MWLKTHVRKTAVLVLVLVVELVFHEKNTIFNRCDLQIT